jgi:hypothetical protein
VSDVIQWEPEGRREARLDRLREIMAGNTRSLEFVESLDLHNLQCGDEAAIRVFVRLAQFEAITSIHLGWNRLGPPAMAVLGESPLGGRVRTLVLAGNDLGDAGVGELCRHAFPSLETLDLAYCKVGDRAADALAAAPMRALRTLLLRRNDLGDAGAIALASSTLLRRGLERLDVDANDNLTRRGTRALREAFGTRLVA